MPPAAISSQPKHRLRCYGTNQCTHRGPVPEFGNPANPSENGHYDPSADEQPAGAASNAPELAAAQMMDITAPPLTSTQSSIQPTAFESTDTHATHGTVQRKRTKIQASSLNTPPQPATRTRQTVLLRPAERFAVSEIPHGALQDGVMAIGGPQTQDYRIRIQPEANLIAIDAWNPSLIPRFLKLTTIQDGVRNFAFRPYEATPPDHARGIFHGFDVKDDGPTLLAQIACRTHKPVAARPLDSQGRSVLVTFAGPTLPVS
ncbi:hypothetical protein HPB49_026049 [Dermacentor silvarum]|nr:hypothetical protein HPB49_026049 [Dermacentor silvarum]